MSVIGYIELTLIVVLLLSIVINISTQVMSRYIFDKPLVWVEEIAVYSFIWSVFLGASLALKYDQHLRIETYSGRLGERIVALAHALVGTLILILLLTIITPLWTAIDIEMRRTTIALPVQVPMGWFFSVPLFVSTLSMSLTLLYRIGVEVVVFRGSPRPQAIMKPLTTTDPDEELANEHAILGRENSGDRP